MDHWLENFARTAFLRSGDTAHDLKTPLNVAVLNLELLRMRLRKLDAADDEKVSSYARSIEAELRRMARIFDAFFVLSTPPRGEGAPSAVDIGAICAAAAENAGFPAIECRGTVAAAHDSRIRQGVAMFFEGASRVLEAEGRRVRCSQEASKFEIVIEGQPAEQNVELSKLFKFYYTDPAGNPDLSLAAARLIAETYGGDLNATQESDKVSLRLSFPSGE